MYTINSNELEINGILYFTLILVSRFVTICAIQAKKISRNNVFYIGDSFLKRVYFRLVHERPTFKTEKKDCLTTTIRSRSPSMTWFPTISVSWTTSRVFVFTVKELQLVECTFVIGEWKNWILFLLSMGKTGVLASKKCGRWWWAKR